MWNHLQESVVLTSKKGLRGAYKTHTLLRRKYRIITRLKNHKFTRLKHAYVNVYNSTANVLFNLRVDWRRATPLPQQNTLVLPAFACHDKRSPGNVKASESRQHLLEYLSIALRKQAAAISVFDFLHYLGRSARPLFTFCRTSGTFKVLASKSRPLKVFLH